MDNNADSASKILSQVFDILVVKNSKGTSMGVIFGIIIAGLSKIALDFLKSTIQIPWYLFSAIGIFIFNLKTLFTKHAEDEKIETALHYIAKIHKLGNFTPEEMRNHYRELINQVIIAQTNALNNKNIGKQKYKEKDDEEVKS